MKLSMIHGQHQATYTAFSGCKSLNALRSILDNGFELGERGSTYFSSLPIATAYSLDYWGQGGREINDKDAYVVEVSIDPDDNDLHPDEDTLSFEADTPSEDDSDQNWQEYLNKIGVEPQRHRQFRDAINAYNLDGDNSLISSLSKTLRYQKRGGNFTDNAAIKRPIHTHGQSRIVAAHVLSPKAHGLYEITKTVFGSGSVAVGTVVSPRMPGR